MCAAAKPGVQAQGLRQLIQGLLGMIAPGELRQVVMAQVDRRGASRMYAASSFNPSARRVSVYP